MANTQNKNEMFAPGNNRLLPAPSLETRRILALSDRKGWHFTILGQAQLPTEPIHLQNWMIVPAVQDSSAIPPHSYEKIQTIYASGIRPKGFVVVHEAPRQLAAPQKAAGPNLPPLSSPRKQVTEPNSTGIDSVTTVAGGIFKTILLVLGATIMSVAMIDPILVAVMEDGSWVEIDRWNTQV